MKSVEAASRNRTAGPIDFSLFTDGLRAEREQGITIDVAYRYFATARRKFILADTPGHEQYTRNMATGASTADVAILLVDARHGVREQTRRHARIAQPARHLELRPRRQQDGPRRLRSRRVRRHLRRVRGRLPAARRVHADPDERAARRQRHRRRATARRGSTGRACSSSSRPSRSSGRSTPARRSACRCSSSCGPTRSSAATPARLRRARFSPATPSPSGRRAGRARSRASSRGTAISRSRRRRCRSRSCSRTSSTSAAATCSPSARSSTHRRFTANVVWMDERPLDPRRVYLIKHNTRIVDGGGRPRPGAERDRHVDGHGVAAARVRSLRRQPHDRQLRADRSGDELHRRRRHDRAARCATDAVTGVGDSAAERLALAARAAATDTEAIEAVRRLLEEVLT